MPFRRVGMLPGVGRVPQDSSLDDRSQSSSALSEGSRPADEPVVRCGMRTVWSIRDLTYMLLPFQIPPVPMARPLGPAALKAASRSATMPRKPVAPEEQPVAPKKHPYVCYMVPLCVSLGCRFVDLGCLSRRHHSRNHPLWLFLSPLSTPTLRLPRFATATFKPNLRCNGAINPANFYVFHTSQRWCTVELSTTVYPWTGPFKSGSSTERNLVSRVMFHWNLWQYCTRVCSQKVRSRQDSRILKEEHEEVMVAPLLSLSERRLTSIRFWSQWSKLSNPVLLERHR